MSEKFIWFDGLKFTRDDKTGYYLNSTIRKRLHRYVWEYHNGPVPKGCSIHHIDGDRSNNDISNLMPVTPHGHAVFHGKINSENNPPLFIDKMNHARAFASEWHKSEAGREWHKEHYEQMKDKLHALAVYTCDNCGKSFQAPAKSNHHHFCSNACKSAWRRKQGVDDVERICVICGKPFKVNKYKKAKCCSKTCRNKSCSITNTKK